MALTEADLDLKTMQQAIACNYEPIQRVGTGAYGFVYQVGDVNSNLFAFKYLLSDVRYNENGFDNINELDILSRVHHPYIIHAERIITNRNCEIDGLALVLPLADKTLYDLITDPTMTTQNKLPILYKLATALEFMHRSHILHLDIKTTNVVLQGDIPYFIDFGLSMVVDDVKIGKYDPRLRVTIDHRPPEIVSGGRTYNAAVDVWSFGIMMLYLLAGKGFYRVNFDNNLKDADFSAEIVRVFNDQNTLPKLLKGVDVKYQALTIDLLRRILQIDPAQRITAKDICDHALFAQFKTDKPPIGYLDAPRIAHNYPPDHRDNLKILLNLAQNLYDYYAAELVFLAVDLFARTSSFYIDRSPVQRTSLAAACLWVAAKLTDAHLIPLTIYIKEISKIAPGITAEMILHSEVDIIHLLSGVLNVNSLYTACTNGDELKLSYTNIVIAKDSVLYAITDIPAWVQLMKTLIPNPIFKDKNITITELFA